MNRTMELAQQGVGIAGMPRRRDEHTEQLIAEAHAPPGEAEQQAQGEDPQLPAGLLAGSAARPSGIGIALDTTFDVTGDGREAAIARELVADEPSYTLRGPEMVAYARLRAAAFQAHAAQQAYATTGAALRDAFQGLCSVIAPGATPPKG